jgi:AraC-like DNA-binding protein
MELINKKEHLNCYLYDNQQDISIVHFGNLKGRVFLFNETHSQIVFLLKGKITFSYGYQMNNIFEEGCFLMFSKGYKYTMNVLEDSDVIIINMHNEINFCNQFPLEILYELVEEKSAYPYPLKINDAISQYLNTIIESINNGLKCAYFQELKQRELLFYLRAYYPKKDLAAFFVPILNNDTRFARLIYKNYESAKSIENLAALSNYSVSGFKKRFMRVFGIAPSNWMEKEKAKKIYSEISCTQKSFKEITVEYNFSSAAHFDKFCKRVYGMSPGVLRKNNKQRILTI